MRADNFAHCRHPIELYGRNGRSINDVWKDGAKAYLGMTVEDMPNFAMLYGPNTNLGHNRYANTYLAP